MFEIVGKVNKAICYAKIIEEEAIKQIERMCDYEFSKDSYIAIMPDVHAGKGCTIGTTMTIVDKVVPNIVGVDIGCGMYVMKLGKVAIDLAKLDEVCHIIPSGVHCWDQKKVDFDLKSLKCYKQLKNIDRLVQSVGTLGGGNHFIELEVDQDGCKYLVIHSGSRNLGVQVANYYQKIAIDLHKGKMDYQKKREELIKTYKELGKVRQLSDALKQLQIIYEQKEAKIPEDLCYLYGEYLDDYLYDVEICQQFASISREYMGQVILEYLQIQALTSFHTIHNYIDVNERILRKGAISAKKDELLLIPINMRDGSILGKGLGNPSWNYSAPHGAGRLMSRNKAKELLNIETFKHEMSHVYTTCVSESTLDESPMAYKSLTDIVDVVADSVEIIEILKPIYNFKASD